MAGLPAGRLSAAELSLGRVLLSALPNFTSSPTPTAVGLPDSRILLANDAFVRLSGYHRDELLGVSAASLITPSQAAVNSAIRERILAEPPADPGSSPTYHQTLLLIGQGRREVAVRASSILLRARDGTPVAFVTRLIEVGEIDAPARPWTRRLGEADATTLEAAIRELPMFDDLPEATSLTSPGGVLLQVNRAFEAAFGWASPDVVGLPAIDLLAPELRSWGEHRLEEILDAELLPRPSQSFIRHRDGRAIEITANSVPVRAEDGSIRYIVATVTPT